MSTAVSIVKASTLCLALAAWMAAPLSAKEAVQASAKADQSKQPATSGSKSASAAESKPAQPAADGAARAAMGLGKPVGAKTVDELVKKLADCYNNKDDMQYATLIKAPLRTRIRLHHQFRKDMRFEVTDVRFVTIEQEAKRFRVSKDTIGKSKTVNGVVEAYPLPVVGFIDFDAKTEVNRNDDPTDVHGYAVGKDKDAYYIVVRLPVEGATPAAAAAPAAGTATGTGAATPPGTVGKTR